MTDAPTGAGPDFEEIAAQADWQPTLEDLEEYDENGWEPGADDADRIAEDLQIYARVDAQPVAKPILAEVLGREPTPDEVEQLIDAMFDRWLGDGDAVVKARAIYPEFLTQYPEWAPTDD